MAEGILIIQQGELGDLEKNVHALYIGVFSVGRGPLLWRDGQTRAFDEIKKLCKEKGANIAEIRAEVCGTAEGKRYSKSDIQNIAEIAYYSANGRLYALNVPVVRQPVEEKAEKHHKAAAYG